MTLEEIRALFAHLHESIYLVIGAAGALFLSYLRDFRRSDLSLKHNYWWYLTKADQKKTEDVTIILMGMIAAEVVTGALTGLEPSQLIMTGAALGIATKIRAGE